MKRIVLALTLGVAANVAIAAPVTYQMDPNHTMVLASWSHFGFSNPVANFGNADGKIVYDPQDAKKSSVEVTLPLSGLQAFVADFNTHLKSADFFDAEKFPTATFKSTEVKYLGKSGKLKVRGDLTIKGITKPVELDATLNKLGEHPMAKRAAVGFDATTTLKRSDFDLGMYAPNVSDEVQLRITTEALVAKPADAAK